MAESQGPGDSTQRLRGSAQADGNGSTGSWCSRRKEEKYDDADIPEEISWGSWGSGESSLLSLPSFLR